jgi:hypothetical protein
MIALGALAANGVMHLNFAVSSRLNRDMVSLMVFALRDAAFGSEAFSRAAFAGSVYVKVGIRR